MRGPAGSRWMSNVSKLCSGLSSVTLLLLTADLMTLGSPTVSKVNWVTSSDVVYGRHRVVLFGEEGSDESDDRSSGWEDADNVGAAPDLLVEPFLGVVGPDLTPMRFGEPGERQNVASRLIEMVTSFGETDLREVIDDTTVLGPHRVGVGLGEDGADHGGHHRF